jgi:hypothetical protein
MADSQTIDYVAVLADLEKKRAELDAAIAGIKTLLGQAVPDGGPGPSGGPGGGSHHHRGLAEDAYLGMSIPEATKKHLSTVRKKVPTRDLMIALEKGGLPKSTYNSVYAVLRRRENQVGDIINMDGDWALAEWYPNHQRTKKATESSSAAKDKPKEKKDDAAKAHKEPKAQKEPEPAKDPKAANG